MIFNHLCTIFLHVTNTFLSLRAVTSTEVVESRLFYEAYEQENERTAAEFFCTQGGGAGMIKVEALDNPQQKMQDFIRSGKQRRWVVRRIYLDQKGDIKVENWSVSSSVNYTCTEGTAAELLQKKILSPFQLFSLS